MNTKKLICLLLLISMCLTAVSCGKDAEKEPSGPEPDAQTDVTPQGPVFGPIRQIGEPLGTIVGSPAKTAHGYYEMSRWNNTEYANIVYTDYATRQTIFLCNVPGCAHNTPDCSSYVAEGNGCILFTDNSEKHLYLIFQGREANEWQEAAPATLTEMNMDGAGRRIVCTLSSDEHFSSSVCIVAGDDYMYALVQHPVKQEVKTFDFETGTEVWKEALVWKESIERIWFSDGKREKIRDMKSDSDAVEGLNGAADDKYLRLVRWDYKSGGSSGSVLLVDQNGETVGTPVTYSSGEFSYVDDKRTIKLDRGDSTAEATMEIIATGENMTVSDIPYPSQAGYAMIYGGYKNRFMMQYIWTESGRDREKAYVLDFDNGTCREFDLRQRTNSHYFVTPIADAGDDYLVLIDRRDTSITIVDKAGVPHPCDYYGRDTYALMQKDDFWNCVPDYRVIEDKLG